MNLGDANLKSVNSTYLNALTAPTYLRFDNLSASKPQLLHSTSKRSVAASDDYYSLSEPASDPSSGDDRATVLRYKTPPLQIPSANQSRDLLRVDQTPPKDRDIPALDTTSRSIRFVEQPAHEPDSRAAGDNMKAWKSSKSDVSPPTPGVDDTPYIQFAINQLTLDEELTGRRRIGANDGDASPVHGDIQPVVDNRRYIQPTEAIVTQEPRRHVFNQLEPQPQPLPQPQLEPLPQAHMESNGTSSANNSCVLCCVLICRSSKQGHNSSPTTPEQLPTSNPQLYSYTITNPSASWSNRVLPSGDRRIDNFECLGVTTQWPLAIRRPWNKPLQSLRIPAANIWGNHHIMVDGGADCNPTHFAICFPRVE